MCPRTVVVLFVSYGAGKRPCIPFQRPTFLIKCSRIASQNVKALLTTERSFSLVIHAVLLSTLSAL